MGEPDRERLRRQLLGWYRSQKRDLPFRRTRDPYAILVAEFILQRTRVAAGLQYYGRFLAAFPTVRALAAASEADILRAWEGLGFYGRARNLHRAAQAIMEHHRGAVPAEFEALRRLPGIGDYTAGAVGSIAFGLRVPAVDGNVTRVLARVFRIEANVFRGAGRRRILEFATELVPADHPGEWNQALMELGATICLPKAPRCGSCPIASECVAFGAGVQEGLPVRSAKPGVPTIPVVFVVARRGNLVLLVRRQEGLLRGMYGLPGGEREPNEAEEDAVRRHLRAVGVRPEDVRRLGPVRHTFSHLRWEGTAYACRGAGRPTAGEWVRLDRLDALPLIPLHRRLVSHVMS